MNILYIGPYRTESGWGVNSREYLECLVNTENNIACRPIFMSNEGRNVFLSDKVLNAEQKLFDETPDVVIQYAIPDYFDKIEGAYNIGIYDTETYGLSNEWIKKIEELDESIVNSKAEAEALVRYAIKSPVMPIHGSVTLSSSEKAPEFTQVEEYIKDKYTFYFIGENNDRKNIMALVKAFHLAFDKDDNVALLIKTNTKFTDEINAERPYWRMKKDEDYIPEICISSRLTDGQISYLHSICNCLVMPSYGESFCYPIAEALYHNNAVLCNSHIFAADLFREYIIGVHSFEVPVFTKQPPMPHIYTAKETWYEIDILDLARKMEKAYLKHLSNPKGKTFIQQEFSREKVTEKLNEYFKELGTKISKT